MVCLDHDDRSSQGGGSRSTTGGPLSVTDHDDDEQSNDALGDTITSPTVNPQQEQHDLWAAAEGYTPLTDIHFSSNEASSSMMMMVSRGPGNDDDDSSNSDNDGNERPRNHHHGVGGGGVFFVNPLAFSTSAIDDNDNDDEEEEEWNQLSEGNNNNNAVVPLSTTTTTANKASLPIPDDVEEYNFQDIASNALLALDDEYQRTVQGLRPLPPRWERRDEKVAATTDITTVPVPKDDDDDDLKIIAKAFDQRKEERLQTEQASGFLVDWETVAPTTSSSNNNKSNTETKVTVASTKPKENNNNNNNGNTSVIEPNAEAKVSSSLSSSSATITTGSPATAAATVVVDTEAVRKVVAALSQKKTNDPFQQKYAAWQEKKKKSTTQHHVIIPPTPLKAFRRSTEKAQQATASLSRSATIAEAIVRLQDNKRVSLLSNSKKLVIDVIGVDHVECASMVRIQTTFRPIVRWLGAWKDLPWSDIHFRLIGRDLQVTTFHDEPVNLLTPTAAAKSSSGTTAATTTTTSKLQTAVATCHEGVYDEWLEQQQQDRNSHFDWPNLVIAFNAGIWGYQEWVPTMQYLQQLKAVKLPLVITAYTLLECQEDYEVLQEAFLCTTTKGGDNNNNNNNDSRNSSSQVLWEPEPNPFGSHVIRETKSRSNEYRENACWQAWILGGG